MGNDTVYTHVAGTRELLLLTRVGQTITYADELASPACEVGRTIRPVLSPRGVAFPGEVKINFTRGLRGRKRLWVRRSENSKKEVDNSDNSCIFTHL